MFTASYKSLTAPSLGAIQIFTRKMAIKLKIHQLTTMSWLGERCCLLLNCQKRKNHFMSDIDLHSSVFFFLMAHLL